MKENFLRGTWKIELITELIKSQDQIEKAAKVQLLTRNTIQQSIYHLFPLECNMSVKQNEMVKELKERAQQGNIDNAKETQAKVEKLK